MQSHPFHGLFADVDAETAGEERMTPTSRALAALAFPAAGLMLPELFFPAMIPTPPSPPPLSAVTAMAKTTDDSGDEPMFSPMATPSPPPAAATATATAAASATTSPSSSRSTRRKRSLDGAEGSSSDGSDARPQPPTSRSRKPTYLVRKEEKGQLTDEIRDLEARLALLRMRAGLPSAEALAALREAQGSHEAMEEAIHAQLLHLGSVQSLVSRHFHTIPIQPIHSYIHLTTDPLERRATLLGLRDVKLRRAFEVPTERLRFIDATKPYVVEERFVVEGKYICVRFDIQQFRGRASPRAVYDALRFFQSSMKTDISEPVVASPTLDGTADDGDDVMRRGIWQHRHVSPEAPGIVEEVNVVGFGEYHEHFGPAGGEPCGVLAADWVDVDELYPYAPLERLRKDVNSGITVMRGVDPHTHEPLVVLRRCVILALHDPLFPVAPEVLDELQTNIGAWSSVMTAFLRDTFGGGGGCAATGDGPGSAEGNGDL